MGQDIETDGGATDVDRDTGVRMSRNVVRDGVFDAVGTVSLLLFSLLALSVGARGFLIGSSTAISGAFVVASCLLAAVAFDLV